MPWTKKDVSKHISGLTDKQKENWVSIANKALRNCIDQGGTDETCAPKAIRIANDNFSESMQVKDTDFDIAQQLMVEAGRKLSKANENKIKGAISALNEILSSMQKESLKESKWYRERMEIVRNSLKEQYPNAEFLFVEDLSDTEAVFEYENQSGEVKQFRVGYIIDESGNVTFGEPVEVERKVYFEPVSTQESQSPKLTEKSIQESPIKLVEKVDSNGVMPIKIISPGWGSSGYYTKEALINGASAYKEGLKMYIDHPTETEEAERPERSVRDIAAVLASDAYYDEQGKEGPGIYAEAKVFNDYKEFINEKGPYIGLSHRASGKATQGEAEGKQGPIISSIDEAHSVDFVTMPGAGGQIVDMLESYRGTNNPNTNQNSNDMSEDVNKKLEEAQTKIQEAEKEKQRLEEENKRLKESQMLVQAKGFISQELKESKLPDVTKQRLTDSLAGKYKLNEKNEIDEPAFRETIKNAVQEEVDYLAKVTGQGTITDFGESSTPQGEESKEFSESMVQSWMDMGYSKEMAEAMAKGRN